MNQNLKNAITIVSTAAVIVVSVDQYIKITRIERANRLKIQEEMHLDLEAIRIAGANMIEKLDSTDYIRHHNVNQLMADLHNEIEFNKIAIREEF